MWVHETVTTRIALLVTAGALLAVGCGATGDSATGDDVADAAGDADGLASVLEGGVLRIGGGTSGGTAERAAGVIARVTEGTFDGVTGAVLPGSGRSNLLNIGESAAELGMGVPSGLESAYTGTGDFEGEPQENVRYGGEMFADLLVFTLVAAADSGIETVADLEGKRLAPGEQASLSAQQFTPVVLETAGLSYDAIEAAGGEIVYTPYGDALQLMRDGHIDALVHTIAHPNAELSTLDGSQGFELVSLTNDQLEQASAELPGWASTTIPAGTYSSQEQDWQTLSTSLAWAVRADLPDDAVYNLTKAIYDSPELWNEAGEGWADRVDLDQALSRHANGLTIPVHPGAQRYYDEVGAGS